MKRNWNWPIYAGFLISLAAFLSYWMVFAGFPGTRDFPWVNLALFAVGLGLGAWGKIRAYWRSAQYRGKVSGPLLGLLSFCLFALFSYYVFHLTYQLPASSRAPAVGQKAPDFTLPDQNGNPVTLSDLYGPALKAEGKEEGPGEGPGEGPREGKGEAEEAGAGNWVLLVFYRGFW